MEIPTTLAEWPIREQQRWVDGRVDDLTKRIDENTIRQLLYDHGFLPSVIIGHDNSATIVRPIYPQITVRNLIYHVYPAGDWESIAREIATYRDIFNGKRIIAIADPGGGYDIQGVEHVCRSIFQPTSCEIFVNHTDLRETITFPWLINSVLNSNPNEATFYAHTKANTTADNPNGATRWRHVMTENLLGRWQDAMQRLSGHAFVGTHKMIWPANCPSPFPTRLRATYPWMHCGTFWWFRHDQVSKLHRPGLIVPDRYGVEAWPSQLIPHSEAYSMWQPWAEHESAYPQLNPYDPGMYENDYSR